MGFFRTAEIQEKIIPAKVSLVFIEIRLVCMMYAPGVLL
jgi:hypothetical protein